MRLGYWWGCTLKLVSVSVRSHQRSERCPLKCLKLLAISEQKLDLLYMRHLWGSVESSYHSILISENLLLYHECICFKTLNE